MTSATEAQDLSQDTWEAEDGITTLNDFENTRAFTLRAKRKVLDKICRRFFHSAEKVLEVGSGTGFLARNIPSEYAPKWIQLEPQLAFLEEARKRNPFGNYVNGSVYNLPFPDASLDAVCGFSSFDVLSDSDLAASEVHRVLAPGGIFVHILDLGANPLTVKKTLENRRVPCYIGGKTDSPYSILDSENHSSANLKFLPESKLDAFLSEVGMSRTEMDALPDVDFTFALASFQKRCPADELSLDAVTDHADILEKYAKFDAITEYADIFDKYAEVTDVNNFFHQELMASLKKHVGESNVQFRLFKSGYRGNRTPEQIAFNEQAHVFEQYQGKTSILTCVVPELLDYLLHNAIKSRFPRLARYIGPRCYERSTLECVIARKES